MKHLFLGLLLTASFMMFGESRPWNLLPSLGDTSTRPDGFSWHVNPPLNKKYAQIITAVADKEQGKLSIRRNAEKNGDAAWRSVIPLSPGVYTIDVQVTAQGKMGVDIYGFDANKKAKALFLLTRTDETFRLTRQFTVPESVVKARLGLTIYNQCQAEFVKPGIYPGKLTAEQIDALEQK